MSTNLLLALAVLAVAFLLERAVFRLRAKVRRKLFGDDA